MRVRPDGPQLISELVRKSVGADCSVLMGANIAQHIGAGQLSEATIGRAALAHLTSCMWSCTLALPPAPCSELLSNQRNPKA